MNTSDIIVGVLLGLAVNEMSDVCPRLAVRVVALAARLQYGDTPRAAERGEVVAAYINDRPGKLFKLLTALGFVTIGAMAGLRRHNKSIGLEVRWRTSEGLMATALGGMIWGADPLLWQDQTIWSMIGGVIIMTSGLVQVVVAYFNRPWFTTVRGVVLMACSVGFALGAVARALTVDVFPIAIIDVALTVFLSLGALVIFAIGLTQISRPADIPSMKQILTSEAARRAERDDPR
ncbi:hypothetical protein [Sphaerisporangium aureirubrum]|uniref:DUF1275 domain-containing protein n=1 Tax=Sphaerisporangium aureirubrum TaxID=1544736 RepID=A0ABW1NJV0_9ACTN